MIFNTLFVKALITGRVTSLKVVFLHVYSEVWFLFVLCFCVYTTKVTERTGHKMICLFRKRPARLAVVKKQNLNQWGESETAFMSQLTLKLRPTSGGIAHKDNIMISC